MIIQNGRIVFIGTTEATNTFLTANNLNGAGACRTIELGGKTILPGISFIKVLHSAFVSVGSCPFFKYMA